MSVFRSLLMLSAVAPEPDIYPYLLAGRSGKKLIKLMASKTDAIYYSNTPQIIIDTLSGKILGQSPFELQFDVHSKSITQGTTQILNADRLMRCFAQGGTLHFKFAWDNAVYELDKKYLKEGWNTIALASDGVKISFKANVYETTLVDASASYIGKFYKGFSNSNYLKLPIRLPVLSNLDIITRACIDSGRNYTMNLFTNATRSNPYSICFGVGGGLPRNPFIYIGSGMSQGGDTSINLNKWYWYRHVLSQGVYKLYTLLDNLYTPSTLPEIEEWTFESEVTFDMFSDSELNIGNSRYDTSSYWNGKIDVTNTQVKANGNVVFDGKNDQILVIGTMEYEEGYVGTPYPQLTVGQISSQVDWTKVRNIKAIIL